MNQHSQTRLLRTFLCTSSTLRVRKDDILLSGHNMIERVNEETVVAP